MRNVGRRVTLRYGRAAARVGGAFFGPLGGRMDTMIAGYRPDQLDAVCRFLDEAVELLRRHRAEVAGPGPT